jgi:hypothetical protein
MFSPPQVTFLPIDLYSWPLSYITYIIPTQAGVLIYANEDPRQGNLQLASAVIRYTFIGSKCISWHRSQTQYSNSTSRPSTSLGINRHKFT